MADNDRLLTAVARLKKHLHAHGCPECGLRFTDACDAPGINGACRACRTGRERPLWEADYDPRACCLDGSRRVDSPDTITAYRLGGPGPWYRCTECARTHPFHPSERHP